MARKKTNGRMSDGLTQPSGKGLVGRSTGVTPMVNPGNRRVVNKTSAPRMQSTRDGLIVANTEMISQYNTTAGQDTIHAFGLNPADANIFPWLSNISRRYSYYRWKRLRVMWSSLASTTNSGQVTLGVMYDLEDLNAWFIALGNHVRALTQLKEASQGPFWGSVIHQERGTTRAEIQVDPDVRRAHMRTPWHICDGSTGGSTPLDNQAVAVYLGMVVGNGGSAFAAGSLWFDYEIEFCHPAVAFASPVVAREREGIEGQRSRPVPSDPGNPPLPKPTEPTPPVEPKPDTSDAPADPPTTSDPSIAV